MGAAAALSTVPASLPPPCTMAMHTDQGPKTHDRARCPRCSPSAAAIDSASVRAEQEPLRTAIMPLALPLPVAPPASHHMVAIRVPSAHTAGAVAQVSLCWCRVRTARNGSARFPRYGSRGPRARHPLLASDTSTSTRHGLRPSAEARSPPVCANLHAYKAPSASLRIRPVLSWHALGLDHPTFARQPPEMR
ncbi:hypothetical protein OH77DRAFT_588344 [Trametes cingulata]|nr:hypothetical protein OH77DRAFT_588344 [Trametes cingulata]